MEVRREGDNVIITLKMSSPGLADEMQRTLDYARVLELTRGLKKIPQEDVDKLADDIKREWWIDNRDRLIK